MLCGHVASRWYGPWGSFPQIGPHTLQSSSGHPQLTNAAMDKLMVALEKTVSVRHSFQRPFLAKHHPLDFLQCSQGTRYLFGVGADLPSSTIPALFLRLLCRPLSLRIDSLTCMTTKRSPQESTDKFFVIYLRMHPRDLPSSLPVLFGWCQLQAWSKFERGLVQTTTPRNLNFASYRPASTSGDAT